MPEPPDEFMTVADVAAILKLNQQTVRNMISAQLSPMVLQLPGFNGGAPGHRPWAADIVRERHA